MKLSYTNLIDSQTHQPTNTFALFLVFYNFLNILFSFRIFSFIASVIQHTC